MVRTSLLTGILISIAMVFTAIQTFALESKKNYLVTLRTPAVSASTFSKQERMARFRTQKQFITGLFGTRGGATNQVRHFWITNTFKIALSPRNAEILKNHPKVLSVVEDALIPAPTFQLDKSRRAPSPEPISAALRKIKISHLRGVNPTLLGQGLKIGNIDSGIDPLHPEFQGKIALWKDFVAAAPQPVDEQGHGTATAGLLVGGKLSGTEIGVAPLAQLIVARAWRNASGSPFSVFIQALEWMADPDQDPNTKDGPTIINNSWGGLVDVTGTSSKEHPLCLTMAQLSAKGVSLIASIGNAGPEPDSVNLPAGCPDVFAVGATDIDDVVPYFSSVGPIRFRDRSILKPQVAAPGVFVGTTTLNGGYRTFSGTSASAPLVTGVVALMMQASPTLSGSSIRRILQGTSKDLGPVGPDNWYGSGRIDAIATYVAIKSLSAREIVRVNKESLP